MEALTQLGIAGVSLGIIGLVVKYFISAIETKDEYMRNFITESHKRSDEKDLSFERKYEKITDRYQKLTQEYITEGISSRNKHIEVLQELTNCVRGCGLRK